MDEKLGVRSFDGRKSGTIVYIDGLYSDKLNYRLDSGFLVLRDTCHHADAGMIGTNGPFCSSTNSDLSFTFLTNMQIILEVWF